MRGRGARRDYAWPEAQRDLEMGLDPSVVALRLGEPIDYVLEVARHQGWAVSWKGQTPDQILDAAERWLH